MDETPRRIDLVQADAKNLQTVDGGRRFVFGDGLEGRRMMAAAEALS
jgi:hypothetical protein